MLASRSIGKYTSPPPALNTAGASPELTNQKKTVDPAPNPLVPVTSIGPGNRDHGVGIPHPWDTHIIIVDLE